MKHILMYLASVAVATAFMLSLTPTGQWGKDWFCNTPTQPPIHCRIHH